MDARDRYEGLGYREMIQWSSRLRREWPLYEFAFADVPERTLLDLGCGPGEHCARFSAAGWRVTGVDVSRAQIESAREHHPELDFVECDLGKLGDVLDAPVGAALCVGNVLPNLDDAAFEAMLADLSKRILDGGRLLLHQLEFGPILAGRRRSIGPIFRGAAGGETAFLRIFCPTGDERFVDFLPTRLDLDPSADPPVVVARAESNRVRARRRSDLESELERHGFSVEHVWGGPERQPHDPDTSDDLWLLARH